MLENGGSSGSMTRSDVTQWIVCGYESVYVNTIRNAYRNKLFHWFLKAFDPTTK